MTKTRIAGQSFDARHATEIQQLARIWGYARHIRELARKAHQATPVAGVPNPNERPRRGPAPVGAALPVPSYV